MLPLIIMYILLIPCAVLFMYFKYKDKTLAATVFKGVSTWLILCGALVGVLDAFGIPSVFSVLISAGLAMGMAGDIALSLPYPGFESGMLFFGLGHLCYIAAFLQITTMPLWFIPVFVVVYAAVLYVFKKAGNIPKSLLIPILIYSAVIILMLSFAATIPLSVFPVGLIPLAAAILFTVSDALLARNGIKVGGWNDTNLVRLTPVERGVISLSCYYLGQSLFAVGIYFLC